MLNGQTKGQLRIRNDYARAVTTPLAFIPCSRITISVLKVCSETGLSGVIRAKEIAGDKAKGAAERMRRRVRRRSSGRGRRSIRFGRQRTQGGRDHLRHPWGGRVGTGSASEEHPHRNCEKILLARHMLSRGD